MKIILSVSSDIGTALAKNWVAAGHPVCGTFRTPSAATRELEELGVSLVHCDLLNSNSISSAVAALRKLGAWNTLVLAAGNQDPVGLFESVNFSDWRESVEGNFTSQLEVLHGLLPTREVNESHEPTVLMFAGGATNRATTHYSAYTISKIASIKFCELMDAEIQDTKFVILGPGWVNTKIHLSTITAGTEAGSNYETTVEKLESGEMFPMEDVINCINWIDQSPKATAGGRNFSAVFDPWGAPGLDKFLIENPDAYKLRRSQNDEG